MMMNYCEEIRRMLGPWLDGELGGSEAEQVRAHLEQCPACLAERSRLERIGASLKGILEKRASEVEFGAFWAGVRRRIEKKKPWHAGLPDWIRLPLGPPRLAWAIPVVIVVLLAVFSLDQFLPGWRWTLGQTNLAAVESIDGHGLNVALFREAKTKTTVIWLFENQEGENETSTEPASSDPAF
jgi:hypothetical protein